MEQGIEDEPTPWVVGRVISAHAKLYSVMTEDGEIVAEVTGKYAYQQASQNTYPAVGDWVVMDVQEGKGLIQKTLSRKTKFSRKIAGTETIEQIVAANFDTVFIVNALNKDYNIRKLERYLVVAWESGARPVVILSKADLCNDVDDKLLEVESIALGVDIHPISSIYGDGLEDLKVYLKPGKTVVVLGSSGVGKSTLVNTLAGNDILKVQKVREDDDRGRHTTTHRELVLLPGGGMILDTPGMRELGLWTGKEGLDNVFEEILTLSHMCKFTDCSHRSEPGCAVREAIENGTLTKERLESYDKLKKEAAYIEHKQVRRAKLDEKRLSRNTNTVRNRISEHDMV
ncbi:MAG: ribosome small subunit-dependent GTPase A [Vallitaleaceae bacterium]|nr:ribosome small subunit-dependent GTPase A [Vallitaleaceae bacterium]